ncbi:MAG TPA: hypothetical protein VL463_04985 [Kofleriaceae bacterium]|jgi:hypothetical protein|nr:hypothetical protein [Kofleriaceae bacterium]
MTSGHMIFIPMVLAVGGLLGFIVGARAARNAFDLERRREAEREKAKAERAARKAAKAAAPPKE